MDCIVHGVAKSQTRLGNFHFPLVHGDKFFDSGIEDVPPPVEHFLLELSTLKRPSWVAGHDVVHSFELNLTVIHVITLVSFL